MRILYDSKHGARVALGVAHGRRNICLAGRCIDLVLRSKDNFYISIHHVFGHAGSAGNECADVAASFGMCGFVSECNVPSFSQFLVQRFLYTVPLCYSHPECLHDAQSRLLLGGKIEFHPDVILVVFFLTLCCAHSIFALLTFGSTFLTLTQCCSDRCAFKLSLPIPQSRSLSMPEYQRLGFRVVPTPTSAERTGAGLPEGGASGQYCVWRASVSPPPGSTPGDGPCVFLEVDDTIPVFSCAAAASSSGDMCAGLVVQRERARRQRRKRMSRHCGLFWHQRIHLSMQPTLLLAAWTMPVHSQGIQQSCAAATT